MLINLTLRFPPKRSPIGIFDIIALVNYTFASLAVQFYCQKFLLSPEMAQIKTLGTDNSPSLTEQKRKKKTKKMRENDSRMAFALLDMILLFGKKKKDS